MNVYHVHIGDSGDDNYDVKTVFAKNFDGAVKKAKKMLKKGQYITSINKTDKIDD